MSQPFDLDAAVGAQTGQSFAFTWGGQQFAIEPLLSRDIEIQIQLIDTIESLSDIAKEPKALLGILAVVVGDDLLAQMRKARPVGGAALMALIEAWMAHEGPTLGKFEASPGSSAATVPPSKRTSRSTRARKTS